jgi:hypothetical protein
VAQAEQVMRRIDQSDQAERLARAIVADIQLYNAQDISRARASGTSLSIALREPIAEGRVLFLSRVAPSLEPVFDRVLAERLAGPINAPPPGT